MPTESIFEKISTHELLAELARRCDIKNVPTDQLIAEMSRRYDRITYHIPAQRELTVTFSGPTVVTEHKLKN